MRFAVLGDIQGNAVALQAIFDALDEEPARLDGIVCTGDVVGRGPQPNEVIALLRERAVATVLGNYDDAVAFDRMGSGRDFPDEISDRADSAAVRWTRDALTDANHEWLRSLPRDLRVTPGVDGLTVKANNLDARATEYRRTFFMRALMGGAFRAPVSHAKRVLMVHGSPRALNEFVRADSAQSILKVVIRDAQADVLISGHAGESFKREVEGVLIVGVGPVNGSAAAEYTVIDSGDEVRVETARVLYDPRAYVEALQRSGLPDPVVAADRVLFENRPA